MREERSGVRVPLLKLILNQFNMTRNERLRELYKKYGLGPEDTFKSPQGWTIITRQGIDLIQAAAGIDIKYEPIVVERDFVVVKATGSMIEDKEIFVETFGEADRSPKGNCRQNYPVAMAEKRAMSRAVLKLSGFYALGAYGEDEGDFEKADPKSINTKQLDQMKSAIIRGDYTADEAFAKAEEAGLVVPESIKYSYRNLKPNA